jgi:peptidoglycan/LPS O-acetylase OafA/YrhL
VSEGATLHATACFKEVGINPDDVQMGLSSDAASPPADSFQLGQRPALDGIRGVSILLVFLYHFNVPFFRGGFIGVDVFFVLSGFLITVLLCEEWARFRRIDFLAFYQRRLVRLFPALVALVAVLVAYHLLFARPGRESPWKEAAAALFYSMNWVRAYHGLPDAFRLNHTWSLSIEEQFYLVWPLLLACLMALRIRIPFLLSLILLGIVASSVARTVHWLLYQDWARVYMGLDTRADGLLTGCAAGVLANSNLLPRARWAKTLVKGLAWAGALVIAVLTVNPLPDQIHFLVGMPVLNLAIVLLLLAVVSSPSAGMAALFEGRILGWLGRVSYGIYLWHWPIRHLMLKLDLDRFPWATPVLGLALSIAAAALSYYGLERYFLRLKKPGGRRPAAPPAPQGT